LVIEPDAQQARYSPQGVSSGFFNYEITKLPNLQDSSKPEYRMQYGQPTTVVRDVEVTEIPSGYKGTLPAGKSVRLMQSLGGSYTVMSDDGAMLRIDSADADAIGETPVHSAAAVATAGEFSDELIWSQLRTVYDPEIPVNIVDLGLVYKCESADLPESGKKVEIEMSMTAPGCGMGDILRQDIVNKVSLLPDVKQVNVEVVFDPPWHPGMMSEAAKLKLGFM
jgi:probable FeS assembly SUF system protein SufT